MSTSLKRKREDSGSDQESKRENKLRKASVNAEDLGIKILVDHRAGNVSVDIVAVHGIGADPKYAWVTGGVNWLEDRKMLPAAVPNARILQFGYDSRWWGWKESKRPVRQRLENIAQSLLQDLAAERADCLDRPLLFIGHCFGGLVIEKSLTLAQSLSHLWPGLYRSTIGVICLGTPHRGTGPISSTHILACVLASNPDLHVEPRILKDIEAGNGDMMDVVNHFVALLGAAENSIAFCCFYEQVSSAVGRVIGEEGMEEFVVDEASARIDGAGSHGLPLDHFRLHKFDNPKDGNYKAVKNEVCKMVKAAAGRAAEQKAVIDAKLTKRLLRLKTWMAAVDFHNLRQDKQRADGTCEWFEHDPKVCDWRSQTKTTFLWVYGKPGCGKTVLASYFLQALEPMGITLHFFCRGTDQDKRTCESILFNLLFQVLNHPKLRGWLPSLVDMIEPLFHSGLARNLIPFEMLCKTFFEVIEMLHEEAICIILDGFDELDQSNGTRVKLLDRIVSVPRLGGFSVKWIMFSRWQEDFEVAVNDFPHLEITPQRIQQDVQRFISLELKQVPWLKDHALQETIVTRLTNNADGMFLWVSLMLETVKRAPNRKAVTELLQDLPVGLGPVYEDTMRQFGESLHPKELQTRNTVLTLAVTTLRPLRVNELTQALATRLDEDAEDIDDDLVLFQPREYILRTCRPLIYISGDIVQVIHFSLKEFLMRYGSGARPRLSEASSAKPHTSRHSEEDLVLSVNPREANAWLGLTCLSYVLLHCFIDTDTLLIAARPTIGGNSTLKAFQSNEKYAFLNYSSVYWAQHVIDSGLSHEQLDRHLRKLLEPAHCFLWLKAFLTFAGNRDDSSHGDLIPLQSRLNEWLSSRFLDENMRLSDEALLACLKFGLDHCRASLGTDDPVSVDAAAELALFFKWRGRPKESEVIRSEILAIHERVSGTETRDYASMLVSVGLTKSVQGKLEEAAEDLQRALAIQENVLGPEHQDTLLTLVEVGYVYQKQCQSTRAQQYLERALPLLRKERGELNRMTLTCQMYLGDVYRDLKRMDEAEEVLKDCLDKSAKVWGVDHAELTTVAFFLAKVYSAQDRHADAAKHFEMILRSDVEMRPDHIYTAFTRYELALVYEQMERFQDAEMLLELACAKMGEVLDKDSLYLRTANDTLKRVREAL